MTTQSETRDGAVRRLRDAVAEQARLKDLHEAARGTAGEASADAARHGADQQVTARDAWLRWVDDDGYRGLNAGPFALRRELED
jgi:glycerol-3-phosphate O-acyltransferase